MPKDTNKTAFIQTQKCPVVRALEIIGGKWRLPIIWQLSAQESMRYNELKRHLGGITNIMLTRSLHSLEENGLILRREYSRIPPHVEYSLTESCKKLLPALEIINEWGKGQMPQPNMERSQINELTCPAASAKKEQKDNL